MRLDIDESSVDSLYVTVWASPYVPLHMGKKENAYKTLEDHFGCRLQVKLWLLSVVDDRNMIISGLTPLKLQRFDMK